MQIEVLYITAALQSPVRRKNNTKNAILVIKENYIKFFSNYLRSEFREKEDFPPLSNLNWRWCSCSVYRKEETICKFKSWTSRFAWNCEALQMTLKR